MSYVFMKSLENKAEKYDKGMNLITFGKISKIRNFIVDNYLKKGETLLDIGMGTGSLLILTAKNGLISTGIDISEKMLTVARNKLENEGLLNFVEIERTSIIEMDEKFQDKSFDKITAILSFSELYQKEQEFCLEQIHRILKENGEFIIVDEFKPRNLLKRILYHIIRTPLVIITFLFSHLTTSALKNFDEKLEKHGFIIIEEKLYLLDTLKLIIVKKKQ